MYRAYFTTKPHYMKTVSSHRKAVKLAYSNVEYNLLILCNILILFTSMAMAILLHWWVEGHHIKWLAQPIQVEGAPQTKCQRKAPKITPPTLKSLLAHQCHMSYINQF